MESNKEIISTKSYDHRMKVVEISHEISTAESTVVGVVSPTSGLTRQPSGSKSNCLCSPTTHAGSFRCRLHRAPSLQRTKSIDSSSSSTSNKANVSNGNTVEAQ
ncbi:hypothetical protein Dsin_010474 [Dipteronia sinensis]|uniref:Uncharacterized protein n=1 Tax=Dipteronia sinensis TaxID=43782 RepID=A0AAE0ECV9_9ROSI|nr:hypothetical protein Dsin_010474 [Dipteronia sinensis]